MILSVLERLSRQSLRGSVRAILSPDEEHASFGLRALAPAIRADAAIVTEATALRLGVRHAGRVRAWMEPAGVVIDRQVAPGEDARAVHVGLAHTIAGRGRVTWDVRESLHADPDHELACLIRKSAGDRGVDARPISVAGWTEAAILAAREIPSVVFGPGGSGAHTCNEWLDLAQAEIAVEILFATAMRYCA